MFRSHIMVILLFTYIAAQAQDQQVIKWRTWQEVASMSPGEKANKKYLIDLYTSWCGWCKRMDKNTFTEPSVVQYVNERFIAIKFDAESKEDIVLDNKVYKYQKMGARGYHELAFKLADGAMKFPTVVFLDENRDLIQAIPGYQDALSLNQIMHYFSDNFHVTMPWPIYVKNYEQILNNLELIDDTPPASNTRLAGQRKN